MKSLKNMAKIKEIPMSDIVVSGLNPRKTFDEDHIKELADSIKENGLIQAIVVRKVGKKPDLKYEIVCGERRYRASKLIGAETIKAEVNEMEDKKAFEIMIIENLQRRDIKPLEEAAALNRLYAEEGYKIKDISRMLGKSDSYVIGRIQLNNIIPEFAELMEKGTLYLIHLQEICKLKPEAQHILFDSCFTPESVAQWDFKVLSMDKLSSWIDEYVMCSLSKAKFNPEDVTYGMCGSCIGCPFNTATSVGNVKDVANPRCTNRNLFIAKNQEALFREAKSCGLPVILAGTTDKDLIRSAEDFGLKVEQLGKREYVVEPVAPSEDVFKDKDSYQSRMSNFRKVKAVFDSNLEDGSVVKVYELANGNMLTGVVKFLYNVPESEHETTCGQTQSLLSDITKLKTVIEDLKEKRASNEIEQRRLFINGSCYSALNTPLSDNEKNVFLAMLLMRFGYDFKKSLGIESGAESSIKDSFPKLRKNLPAIIREFIRTVLSEPSVKFSADLASLLDIIMKERFEKDAQAISDDLDRSMQKSVSSLQSAIEEKKRLIADNVDKEEPKVSPTVPEERMVPALVED